MSINNDSSKEIESSLETEKTFFFGPERLPQAYKQQEEQTTKAKIFRFLQYLNKVYGRYDSIEDFQRKGRVAKSKTFLQNVKEVSIDIFNNLKAGITVALVSIPLSISLALASDASPLRGLITAAWAGLVGSLLGGSRFSIHGPTGAVSGLLFSYSLQWGQEEKYIHCILTIWAGIIILLMFLLNLHKYFLIIPSSVILGWTVGVALIIGLNQLRFVFGIPGTVDLERYPEFYMNVAEVLRKIGHINYYAVVIFLVFLVALAILVNILPKLPWNIVAAVAGILMGAAIQLDWIPNLQTGLETISIRYGNMDAGFLFDIPKVSSFYNFFKPEYIIASISLAFTVTLETLVSCKVTDEKIAKRMPREVMGLGVANIVSGAMGGIVCAAALARTVLNMKSGASSRLAGITCAVGVYLVSVVFFKYFQFLLLPVTGSILVLVAIRMVKYEEIINLYKFDRKMFILMIVSCIVTIFRSPTEVIIYGTCIGLILHGVDVGPGHTEIQIRKGREIVSLEHSILIDERLEAEEEMVELYLKQLEAQRVIEAQKAKQAGKATPQSAEVSIAITPSAREIELETPAESQSNGEENEESDTNETSIPVGLTQSVSMLDIQQKLEMSTGIHTPWGPVSHNTTMVYHLSGELSYINADNHLLRCRRLAKRPDHKFVIFACRHLYYIDVDGLYGFEKMVQAFASSKRQVYLSGIHEDSRNIVCAQLYKMKWFNDMKANGQIFYNESDALEATIKAL